MKKCLSMVFFSNESAEGLRGEGLVVCHSLNGIDDVVLSDG